jgi:hypothetical protein
MHPLMHPLQKAQQEERDRTALVIKEVHKLYEIVQAEIKQAGYDESNIDTLKGKVLSRLTQDSANINLLMRHLSDNFDIEYKYALNTNKNYEIFEGAKKLVENKLSTLAFSSLNDSFKMDPDTLTILGGKDGDVKDTSMLNFLQTALLTTLCVVKNATSLKDLEVLSSNGIYQVDSSPCIQATTLPIAFKIEALSELKNWFYYYKDEKSPDQGELLIPILGYAYGGSRLDNRYKDKALKAEDCSSAVGKWLGLNTDISTAQMLQAYNDKAGNPEFSSLLKVASPLKNEEQVKSGDIFVFKGHTGFVSKVCEGNGCNRIMNS